MSNPAEAADTSPASPPLGAIAHPAEHRWRGILLGLQHALFVVPIQIVLIRAFEFVSNGTRAQAVGACVASLVMLVSGLSLGIRARRRAEPIEDDQRFADYLPRSAIVFAALFLSCAGVALNSTGLAELLLPESALAAGGIGRAVFATDEILVPGAILLSIGVSLGFNARAWSISSAILASLFWAGLSAAAAFGSGYLSYDPAEVRILALVGMSLSALITGFVLSWARRSLAFVEQCLVALIGGYAIYLLAAAGPKELIQASNVPEEQILVALALVPGIGLLALIAVGGSIGFLLLGGGRFDPGFRFESRVGLRYLKDLDPKVILIFFLARVVPVPLGAAAGVFLGFGIGGPIGAQVGGFIGGPLLFVLVRVLFRRLPAMPGTSVVALISVLGVSLGVMALIVVLSVMSGFEDDLKRKILGAHAHIVLEKHGDDFLEYKEVEDRAHGVAGVETAAAFVLGDAMISSDIGLSGTLVKGIDPSAKDATADLRRNIEKGSLEHMIHPELIPGARPRTYFHPSTSTTAASSTRAKTFDDLLVPAIREPLEGGSKVLPGIIIGRELSRTLRAYVGDTVKLVSPVSEEIGPTGPHPKLRRFRIAGIFYSGMYEYDAKFTYVEITQAQRFFGMRNKATGVEIKVNDVDDTTRIVEELKRRVGGYPYTVKDWRAMNKELFSALLLEKLAMFIILTFIVLVASFNIVATLVMIVLEKGKEIAILKSLGASDASIMKVFVVQGLIVGVGGALLGFTLGVSICLLIEKFGVKLDQKIFYIEQLPVVMDWGEITAIAIAAVMISYLATIYPAMTAARLRPVEGLRDD